MRKAGKVLAGWTDGSDIMDFTCGCPPSLDDIGVAKEKIHIFVLSLLGDHRDNLNHGVANLLVANMLRFWDDFIAIIQKDPKKRYSGDFPMHPFVQKVRKQIKRYNLTFNIH